MQSIKISLATFAAGVLILSGCRVGPNYKAPAAATPEQFDIGPELLPTTLPIDAPTTAATTEPTVTKSEALAAATRAATQPAALPVDLRHWWTALDDPELNSLVTRAVASNLDVAMAVSRVQEVRANYKAVTGDALPSVDISGAYAQGTGTNDTKGRVGSPLNAGTNTGGLKEITQVIGFDATWELDLFGQLAREDEAARAEVESSMEARNQVLVSVIADLSRSYIDLRSNQLRLRITNDNIEALQRTLHLTRVSLQQGIGTELDVVLSERQLAAALSSVGPLEAGIRQSERQIAVLLGLQPEALYDELDRPAEIPAMLAMVDTGIPLELVRRRPDVRQAERRVAAATARIGVATADLFPEVAISAGLGLQGQGWGRKPDEISGISTIGPYFRVPLLDFGRLDALVKVEDYRTQQSLLSYRKSVLTAVEEVENALTNYHAERNRFDQLTVAVDASQQAVNLATERYRRGLADFLNVLDAQRQLYDLEDQLAGSRQLVSVQLIALFKALGGGWEGFDQLPPPPKVEPAVIAAMHAARQMDSTQP